MSLRCVVSALVLLGSVSAARADLIELTGSGQIDANSGLTAFPVGQFLTVTMQFETSGAPQFIQNQQAFYVDHFASVRFATGSYDSTDNTGPFGQIVKSDNLAGTDGISFHVANNQGYYQFANPKPQVMTLAQISTNSILATITEIRLNLASTGNAVWSNYDIPTSYIQANFDGNNNITLSLDVGSVLVGLDDLHFTNLSAVPEPAHAILMLLGAPLLALVRTRRSRRPDFA
jgi:hypothetical protein